MQKIVLKPCTISLNLVYKIFKKPIPLYPIADQRFSKQKKTYNIISSNAILNKFMPLGLSPFLHPENTYN